ncbi:MAG: 5-(carboxyamino)imidazole ribonucleotide synthase [bacterium]
MHVGILGGGQLAQMLAESALRLKLNPLIYTEDERSPASKTGAPVVIGRIEDREELRRFLSQVDTVVFENEFVDCQLLEQAAQDLKLLFFPGLSVIRAFQDKFTQKEILQKLNLPTASFISLEDDSPAGIVKALHQFPQGAVFKWSRMGYDGKGVLVVSEIQAAPMKELQEFCRQAKERKAHVYVEEKVDFQRELAIVAVRSVTGQFSSYPLVLSEQEKGICRRVMGPATALGVTSELEKQAQDYARTLGERMSLVGCFALELFHTRSGDLMVNEIAPRVHNSGHYTQDACSASQFENHWRGVFGEPLGETKTTPVFAMLNLLGPEGVRGKVTPAMIPSRQEGIFLHWYEKEEIRPSRKMGHLNAVGKSPEELNSILGRLEKNHEEWVKALRKQP